MLWMVQKFNFLNIGRQKNLVYAVSVTFLALLYLSLVRRVGAWLEPVLPPEATAAILLFLLVVFVEPLQRVLGRTLREAAQREVDRVQRLTAEIHQEARQGNLAVLVKFIERRARQEFELAAVTLCLIDSSKAQLRPRVDMESASPPPTWTQEQLFLLQQGQQLVATLRAEPHGATISGDTRAALEFLCEQLPGALDLCRRNSKCCRRHGTPDR